MNGGKIAYEAFWKYLENCRRGCGGANVQFKCLPKWEQDAWKAVYKKIVKEKK